MIKLFYHNFDSGHTDGATVNQYSELIHTAQIFFQLLRNAEIMLGSLRVF